MRYSRQKMILEFVEKYEIGTQEALLNLLKENGYDATQATVSRDIRDLQLVKVPTESGKSKYAVSNNNIQPVSERFLKIFKETVKSFASAQNLVVVKTLSGCGSAAAEAIDSLSFPNIVGSVAGDNTLLIIVDSTEHAEELIGKLNDLML